MVIGQPPLKTESSILLPGRNEKLRGFWGMVFFLLGKECIFLLVCFFGRVGWEYDSNRNSV